MNLLALLADGDWFRLPFYWHLPILIVCISLVYSATRHDDWQHIWPEAFRWAVRMLGFLFLLTLVLFGLASFI